LLVKGVYKNENNHPCSDCERYSYQRTPLQAHIWARVYYSEDIMKDKDYITLKWGTLKSWKLTSEKAKELIKKYNDIGESISAITQHDTPEQKQIICELIDTVPGEIYRAWDGKYVSKEDAKKYVMEYP
jgi:hypothetical protein